VLRQRSSRCPLSCSRCPSAYSRGIRRQLRGIFRRLHQRTRRPVRGLLTCHPGAPTRQPCTAARDDALSRVRAGPVSAVPDAAADAGQPGAGPLWRLSSALSAQRPERHHRGAIGGIEAVWGALRPFWTSEAEMVSEGSRRASERPFSTPAPPASRALKRRRRVTGYLTCGNGKARITLRRRETARRRPPCANPVLAGRPLRHRPRFRGHFGGVPENRNWHKGV
jgi:hypothetical protein